MTTMNTETPMDQNADLPVRAEPGEEQTLRELAAREAAATKAMIELEGRGIAKGEAYDDAKAEYDDAVKALEFAVTGSEILALYDSLDAKDAEIARTKSVMREAQDVAINHYSEIVKLEGALREAQNAATLTHVRHESEIASLRASLEAAQRPDCVALVEDTTMQCPMDDLLLLEIGYNEVAEVEATKALPNMWAAHIATKYSDDFEDVEESEVKLFATEQEARAAIAVCSRSPEARQ